MNPSPSTDCLIIGGGVVGLSLAYELVQHGLRVCVLDQGEPGREASWAGAGILPPANPTTAVHAYDQLRGLSFQLHADWADRLRRETGIDTGYRRCGGLYVARTIGEAAALRGLMDLFDAEAIPFERLDAARRCAVEPGLSGEIAWRSVFLVPDEAQLRNPRHLQALQVACQRRGVRLESHAPAQRFRTAGHRLIAVETPRGNFSAERYCIAAGAWSGQLAQHLGVRIGVLPIRGQMILFRCPQPPVTHLINEGPRYLVPRDDGRLLVGSTEEEVGFDKATTREAIHGLRRLAVELVPALGDAELERTWAGLRPGSVDGFPYLGALPSLENAFLAAGHFRSGLYLSTGTAVVMSELIRDQVPRINLAPFSVLRGSGLQRDRS